MNICDSSTVISLIFNPIIHRKQDLSLHDFFVKDLAKTLKPTDIHSLFLYPKKSVIHILELFSNLCLNPIIRGGFDQRLYAGGGSKSPDSVKSITGREILKLRFSLSS